MNPTSQARAALHRALIPVFSLTLALSAPGQGTSQPHPGIDANGNQISDVYEALYPNIGNPAADNDSDGASNKDEAAAGTNPGSRTDILGFSSLTNSGTQIQASWRTVAGKSYQVQSTGDASGTWVNAGSAVMGDGNVVTSSIPAPSARLFLRIRVSDVDSDEDGVSDWEERQAGTDPYQWDSDGDGRSDLGRVQSILASPSRVNIYPASSWGSETGPKTASFRITREGGLLPLNVSFTASGSATRGTDYTLSAVSATLAAGATSTLVTVTPLEDAILEDAETVTLTLTAGANYTVGANNSATITIISQGLIGKYYDTSSGTYANAANFDPAQLKITRRDAAIDFDWSKPAGTPPGTGTGTPGPEITDDDTFTIQWSGFIIPKYSEVYTLHGLADRGMMVWCQAGPTPATPGDTTGVRGSFNLWGGTTNPSTEVTGPALSGSAAMVAGKPYYFRVEYRDNTTFTNNANIKMMWSSPSQTKEVIPAGALSSEGFIGTAPVITSSLAAAGISGAPFSYQITASNTPTSFFATGLPAGLSVNAAGLITGTATGAGGYYSATITASNAVGSDSKNLVIFLATTGGAATREVWNNLTGTGLNSVPLHTAPTATTTLTQLEAPDNAGDNFGERIRGYITAPSDGLYTFLISTDENAELWVSASEEPGRRLKRAWVSAGNLPDDAWDTLPSQRSVTMRMSGGDRYYFEALRRETSGNDHLAIAWLKPGVTDLSGGEIIPSWALSPYTPPEAGAVEGTLYSAKLVPQNGAGSLGSGVALLLVNNEKTAASLTFTYSNLTGPVSSGQHIHDSRVINGQAGRIIYDVDDFPADVYGSRPWVFEASLSHSVADIVAAIEGGYAYLNLHTPAYPDGEIKGVFYPVIGSQFFIPPANPVPAELTLPSDTTARQDAIVRFLQQATFGARWDTDGVAPWDPDSIEAVEALGYAGWINAQMALPRGPDPETLNLVQQPSASVYALPTSSRQTPNALSNIYYGSGPLASYINEYYTRYPRSVADDDSSTQGDEELWRAWWSTTVKGQDQLRQRMAFALSEIIVVSEDNATLDENARAMAQYYDLLYYHAFGNFRTLLERVTLNPAMGIYLDMLGNRKPNLSTGYIPNENFAREILQLFSVGLNRLHPDGSEVLSTQGLPLPTYSQDNVVGFAHTFTGWNYPGSNSNHITAMAPRITDHATGEKLLLESAVIPALSPATVDSCNAELANALDVIFHHPNVGPFVCRQLIQRMVTANPSPGYIYRVASVFNDNGSGVRGDLGAVARAVLLDPEARNAAARASAGFGHLKEPVMRVTQMLRAFKGFSYSEANFGNTIDLGNCIVATQSNIDLSQPLPTTDIDLDGAGTQAARTFTIVDGYTLGGVNGATPPVAFGVGNTLLVRNQTNPSENGVYVFNGNGIALTRAPKADTAAKLNGAWVRVTAGTDENKDFRVTSTVGTLGTDPVVFTEQTAANTRRHVWEMGSTGALGQTPLRAPTVFNFFEPNYVFLGATGNNGLYGPEFQITSETSVISVGEWFYNLTRQNGTNTPETYSYGQGYQHPDPVKRDIKLNLAYEASIATDSGALVDRISGLIMPGQMTPSLRGLLVNYLNTLPTATNANKMTKIGEAFYLISLTPEFATQK